MSARLVADFAAQTPHLSPIHEFTFFKDYINYFFFKKYIKSKTSKCVWLCMINVDKYLSLCVIAPEEKPPPLTVST